MATRLYETLYMLDSTKASADTEAARGVLHTLLEKHGAEIVVSRPWDENRKLMYSIRLQNTTHKKAYYYILYYRMESTHQAAVEADLRINELVLRHLTSVIDPKWEDVMLDSAQNDHATAFAIRGMQDETVGGDVTPNLAGMTGDDDAPPPPRRARREYADKE